MTTQRNYGSRALVYYIEGNERAVSDAAQTIARNEHKAKLMSRNIREEEPRTALAVAKLRERGLTDEARRAVARMKLNIARWEISLEMYRARVRKAKQALKKAQAVLMQRKADLGRKLAKSESTAATA